MSEYVTETPYIGKQWCPTCQPDLDPTTEILETRYCWAHPVTTVGSADGLMPPIPDEKYGWFSGGGEANAESIRAITELIR